MRERGIERTSTSFRTSADWRILISSWRDRVPWPIVKTVGSHERDGDGLDAMRFVWIDEQELCLSWLKPVQRFALLSLRLRVLFPFSRDVP